MNPEHPYLHPHRVCKRARRAFAAMRCKLKRRSGFGTLEVVIIIAVLLAVALLFRSTLTAFARNLIQTVLGDQSVISDLALPN